MILAPRQMLAAYPLWAGVVLLLDAAANDRTKGECCRREPEAIVLAISWTPIAIATLAIVIVIPAAPFETSMLVTAPVLHVDHLGCL